MLKIIDIYNVKFVTIPLLILNTTSIFNIQLLFVVTEPPMKHLSLKKQPFATDKDTNVATYWAKKYNICSWLLSFILFILLEIRFISGQYLLG